VHPELRQFFRIDTTAIHHRLHAQFDWLRDDFTVHGPAHQDRQDVTRLVRRRLLDQALAMSLAIVNDSANLERKNRVEILGKAKASGYETIIIWVQLDEARLLKRLHELDQDSLSRSQKPAWVDLYEAVQKPRFEPPEANEADRLIEYRSEVDAPDKIKL